MHPQDTAEAQLEALAEELRKLQRDLDASERQLAKALELLQKHESRLSAHDTSISRLDRILMELLTGGIWRTLSATSRVAKRLLRPVRSRTMPGLVRGPENSYLTCDDPKPKDRKPRGGMITVRGWALAEHGVDSIRLEIPGLEPIEAEPTVPRPDVKKSYPGLDRTGRAGFAIRFDSQALPSGRHPIFLRLVSRGAVLVELETAITVDHQKGFASDYDRWIHEFEHSDDELIELKLRSFERRPRISVIMPVYNTIAGELTSAIQSVINQSYDNWELCIADDHSPAPHVRETLDHFARTDSRIKVAFRSENGGISRASNTAWDLATGDYLCFLDHDDTLSPHALAYIIEALNNTREADLLYSDEDKIDRQDRRFDPFFKPDWSPDLLRSENYVCHLLVLRRDLANQAGKFRPEYDGSQDYDLILRASEQARHVEHIAKVLYHWRAGESSTASTLGNKEYAVEAARKALQQSCERAGNGSRIEPSKITGRWRARYPIPSGTRVSIIIASGGRTDVLRANLESLLRKTTYSAYEVVVSDNSRTNAIQSLVQSYRRHHANVRYIDWRHKPFNYSEMNNTAARQCDSPVLLFLNDDTSVIMPEWLEAMLELALRPEVGAVGPKLLYPNGYIQHGGVVMGLYDNCGHAFKGLNGGAAHYFDFPDIIRNVSAVTGACLMTRAEVFWRAGGFDEEQFAVAFNDVDLCLKMGALGYRILYTPHAQLYHHEAFSKTSKDLIPHPEEVAAMRSKWGTVIAQDPYYSPNLTRNDEDYSLRTRI
ncbi:MAG: glycosyltransferase family 2 protein [Acidobacteriaceae bacterium]|nr:glycosyltransferase family 2 protein [Acidobacteriaceae bacterium]